MKYTLSEHAKIVQVEREISKEWIEHVLNNPEIVMPDKHDLTLEHRIGRIKSFGNRFLRVVLNHSVKPVNIVTVYFDRNAKAMYEIKSR